MGILDKLFGSHARARLLKLFYLNPEAVFAVKDAARRAHVSLAVARREIWLLCDIGFLKQAMGTRVPAPRSAGKKATRRKFGGYALNPSFSLFAELRDLMLTVAPLSKQELTARLRRVGRVKLVVLAGIFLKRNDSRIDMLVVGDNLKKGTLERTLKGVEAEIGKELQYAILDTSDFKYRLGMNDKFVRDVFDYPHEIILDKIGVVR